MWPAKKQHLAFLAEVRRVLRPGGRLVMVNAGVGSVIWLHRLRQAGFFVEKTKARLRLPVDLWLRFFFFFFFFLQPTSRGRGWGALSRCCCY